MVDLCPSAGAKTTGAIEGASFTAGSDLTLPRACVLDLEALYFEAEGTALANTEITYNAGVVRLSYPHVVTRETFKSLADSPSFGQWITQNKDGIVIYLPALLEHIVEEFLDENRKTGFSIKKALLPVLKDFHDLADLIAETRNAAIDSQQLAMPKGQSVAFMPIVTDRDGKVAQQMRDRGIAPESAIPQLLQSLQQSFAGGGGTYAAKVLYTNNTRVAERLKRLGIPEEGKAAGIMAGLAYSRPRDFENLPLASDIYHQLQVDLEPPGFGALTNGIVQRDKMPYPMELLFQLYRSEVGPYYSRFAHVRVTSSAGDKASIGGRVNAAVQPLLYAVAHEARRHGVTTSELSYYICAGEVLSSIELFQRVELTSNGYSLEAMTELASARAEASVLSTSPVVHIQRGADTSFYTDKMAPQIFADTLAWLAKQVGEEVWDADGEETVRARVQSAFLENLEASTQHRLRLLDALHEKAAQKREDPATYWVSANRQKELDKSAFELYEKLVATYCRLTYARLHEVAGDPLGSVYQMLASEKSAGTAKS